MSDNRVHLQPAFILQYKKYKETSLILELLTRDYGRLSILAKGVRKQKSKTAGLLQPFIPLTVSYAGKSDLKSLTDVSRSLSLEGLKGVSLYCGFYINELVQQFLHKYDPHPEVFNDYQTCLAQLSTGQELEQSLRVFELNLMQHIGYGLHLKDDCKSGHSIQADKNYHFNVEQGAWLANDGDYKGATLLALHHRHLNDTETRIGAKKIMRLVIDYHLEGKILKSRAIISQIIKQI